jgi:hypothetical protein
MHVPKWKKNTPNTQQLYILLALATSCNLDRPSSGQHVYKNLIANVYQWQFFFIYAEASRQNQ